jgi:hypothetical protein
VTFTATRDGSDIIITHTYGPSTFKMTEHYHHMEHFWGQLGALISEAKRQAAVRAQNAPDLGNEPAPEHLTGKHHASVVSPGGGGGGTSGASVVSPGGGGGSTSGEYKQENPYPTGDIPERDYLP